jgi:hypothetical protein
LFPQAPDAGPKHPAVEFELGLAGAATHADPAALTLEVSPAPDQPRRQVLEAGEFDLQFALMAPRSPRENVEDEFGSVNDREFPLASEVALLDRREFSVEDHGIDRIGLEQGLNFLSLAGSYEIGRIRTRAPDLDRVDRFEARGTGETVNFRGRCGVDSSAPQRDRNQQATLNGSLGGGTQLSALS